MTPAGVMASIAMEPLLKRGRAAFRAYLLTDPELRAWGATQLSLNVVTRSDFVGNVEAALGFVEGGGGPCHVLCESGALCVLIEKRHL